MIQKNNNLNIGNDFDDLLKNRKFEKNRNGLVKKILIHTKKIKKPNRSSSHVTHWLWANVGYALIATFVTGIMLGYYVSPFFQQNDVNFQTSYVQNFLYPYGLTL